MILQRYHSISGILSLAGKIGFLRKKWIFSYQEKGTLSTHLYKSYANLEVIKNTAYRSKFAWKSTLSLYVLAKKGTFTIEKKGIRKPFFRKCEFHQYFGTLKWNANTCILLDETSFPLTFDGKRLQAFWDETYSTTTTNKNTPLWWGGRKLFLTFFRSEMKNIDIII